MSTRDNTAQVATGEVHVAYHTFWLRDRLTPAPSSLGVFENGLVSVVRPGSICISTGISSGTVAVTVETGRARLPPPALDEWDEIAEVSFVASANDLLVTSLFARLPAELPSLTPHGPGDYRLRVCARDRDRATDRTESGVETYTISTWPEEPGPPVVHKQSDSYGRVLRARAAAVLRLSQQAPGTGQREAPRPAQVQA